MKTSIQNMSLLAGITFMLFACQSGTTTSTTTPTEPPPAVVKPTECKNPRSQMCSKEYRPVCATKDTGVRCVTTPCPSTEKITYSNGCMACTDSKVYSYVVGACH
ncbi:MAG: hypothetical protein V3U84_05830 [Thiotrichaceae bacterium]